MQTQSDRGESIVAPQALFTMNSSFVVDQARAVSELARFVDCETDSQRITVLFETIFQRPPAADERDRVERFVELQSRLAKKTKANPRFNESPWPMVAQALLMANEFQYLD